ncbi:MAG: hypothetical protein RR347_08380 [Anaerovoracaceae bacterium]
MGFNFFEKRKMVIIGAMAFCGIMVVFPTITATASKGAILLWLNGIVPMLLPFFIFSNFLKGTGAVNRISPKVYPFVMGILSGYPMGARIAGDYCREKIIDSKKCMEILSYSMVTGPAFIIGTVGIEFLGSYKCGLILAVSHYLSAMANSVFYKDKDNNIDNMKKVTVPIKNDYYNIFTDAILDSFKSMAIILAYIIVFMITTDLLQFSGVLSMIGSPEIEALAKGFLEMTVGCNSLIYCSDSLLSKTVIAAFMVTFGGMSVLGQSMSMLKDCNVKMIDLLKMKMSQGIIAAILAFSIGSFVL